MTRTIKNENSQFNRAITLDEGYHMSVDYSNNPGLVQLTFSTLDGNVTIDMTYTVWEYFKGMIRG